MPGLAVKSQREPSGKLRIGAFSSLCTAFLPDLLRQYHQLYPKVDLVVRSGGIEALRDMLGSGPAGFRMGDCGLEGEKPVAGLLRHVPSHLGCGCSRQIRPWKNTSGKRT